MNESLAIVEPSSLASKNTYQPMILGASPAEAAARYRQLGAFVQEVMKDGIDYGAIPGLSKPGEKEKKVLFQPGAQKLAEIYGLAWSFDFSGSIEDWDKPFFYFKCACVLRSKANDQIVGNGIGSCNSKEDRYAWRWVWADKIPKGTKLDGLVSRTTKNGSTTYRFPNDDIYSLVNTMQKMAAKRSYVHAIIAATRSGGLFDQDLEDQLTDRDFGKTEAEAKGPSVLAKLLEQIEKATTPEQANIVGRDAIGLRKHETITDSEYNTVKEAVKARREKLAGGAAPAPKVEAKGEVKSEEPKPEPQVADADAPPPEDKPKGQIIPPPAKREREPGED